jgi:hypothetical protein
LRKLIQTVVATVHLKLLDNKLMIKGVQRKMLNKMQHLGDNQKVRTGSKTGASGL